MMKKVKKLLVGLSTGISILLLISLILLLCFSPQKTAPFLDENGNLLQNSITSIESIDLNGVEQRVLIRGANKDNPVLLHLHGGPGSPDHPFMKRNGQVLEDLFTVCYWEHRGSGASYSKDIPVETMNLNQIVADGIALSQQLRERFQKEKIYIQGHSWGTAVATHMVQKNPELFHAYFGIGQIADPKLSDQLSYDFTLQAAKNANDQNTIQALKKIGRPPYSSPDVWTKAVMVERQLMRPYQNAPIHREESMLDIYKAFVLYPEYSIGDKLGALKGDPFSMKYLWPEVIKFEFILKAFQAIRFQSTFSKVNMIKRP